MKNFKNNISFLFLFFTFLTSLTIAQNKVPNLQDLIGVKGSSAEYELGKRGYKHISTSKTDYDSYSNWWHETGKKCVSIRVNNGRVKSAVYAPPFDCKKSSHFGKNSYHQGLQSIVGDNASSAENQMERMGYRHMNTSKSGGSAYANWWNKNSRKCITVRVSNGVVKSVKEVPAYDCKKSSSSGDLHNSYSKTYQIRSLESGLVLDANMHSSNAVSVYRQHGGANQKWIIKHLGGDDVSIVNVANGKALTASNSSRNGEMVSMKPWTNSNNQKWYLEKISGNEYYIVNKANRKVLDVSTGKHNMSTYEKNGSAHQKWILEKTY